MTPGGALSALRVPAPSGRPAPALATGSDLSYPEGVAVDDAVGDLYIADAGSADVEEVTPAGVLRSWPAPALSVRPTPGRATRSDLGHPIGVAVSAPRVTSTSPTPTPARR